MDRVIGMLNKVSGFVAAPTATPLGGAVVGGVFFIIIICIIYGFLIAYGAANLSYCYNLSLGNGSDVAFFYSVICFFFPTFYYPYYSLFLNPLCASASAQYGGKKNFRK